MEAIRAENETGWMRVEAAIARRAKEAAEQDARRAEAAAELEARREARLAKLESKLRDEVASLREAEAKRDAEAAKRDRNQLIAIAVMLGVAVAVLRYLG